MGYVAVKGGQKAIEKSDALLKYSRISDRRILEVEDILAGMKPLIGMIMSEASLYDPLLAALAIKQAQGSSEEAVFLLRAHRSTIPRLYYSTTTEPDEMFVRRRISASFKDIPGGQVLGRSEDFTQRFLNFDLLDETEEEAVKEAEAFENAPVGESQLDLHHLPRVIDYLEEVGLYDRPENIDEEPDDITKESIRFPSSRSQRLQSLTRGRTGTVTSFGYAEIRSYGFTSHPNIGELRVGDLPIHVQGMTEDPDDAYYIGAIEVTEVQSFISVDKRTDEGKTVKSFDIGYGLVYGQNETKAIAMSILDHSMEHRQENRPTSEDEFVLLHIDSVESTGFISHLKLPHYVTFQSLLDGMRQIGEQE